MFNESKNNRGILTNLPEKPYIRFFGRENAIEKIKNTLLNGGTFIASIDGVGGIGKTALAHHFCETVIVKENNFDYLVWLTAKKTVFDPFSRNDSGQIKLVEADFKGIESLIDATLSVVGLVDYLDLELKEKKDFFESEIIVKEKIVYVLDNLETVNDEAFFQYLLNDFNRFAALNSKLKVLTTSRKRKRIIDNPIDIEGLSTEDALSMLKFLANEFEVRAITNAPQNLSEWILKQVGNVPLGIEFVVGQLKAGKDLGKIKQELEGFPSVESAEDDFERKKRLSQIILFSFENMYETLSKEHQIVFQTIAVLHKNRKPNEEASVDILMSLTGIQRLKLEFILENLEDYKLIKKSSGQYSISQMALNFVQQNYDFEEFENSLMPTYTAVTAHQEISTVDRLIGEVDRLENENKYQDAEIYIEKFLEDFFEDRLDYAKLHHRLALIQKTLQKFKKSALSFEKATNFDERNPKIWFDRILFEEDRDRHDVAILLCEKALQNTNFDVSILNQMLNIYKFKQNYLSLRNTAEKYLEMYLKHERKEDAIRLLRFWKQVEYSLAKNGSRKTKYIETSEKLVELEEDKEIKLQIMREMLKLFLKNKDFHRVNTYKNRISSLENKIRGSISSRVQLLNRLLNNKEHEKAVPEARKILTWYNETDVKEDFYEFQNALRVLLQILSTEGKFELIIRTFEDYPSLGYGDENCAQVYAKAKRAVLMEKRELAVKKISANLQEAEINLRSIIMFTFEYDENQLITLINIKNKQEWVEQWKLSKNRSLKEVGIIHFSDLSHIRALYSWQKSKIMDQIKQNAKHLSDLIESITYFLEKHISNERNDAFHSRLQLEEYSDEEIYRIDADTGRFNEYTKKIIEALSIRRN
jgi:hypothetical protein